MSPNTVDNLFLKNYILEAEGMGQWLRALPAPLEDQGFRFPAPPW